MKNWFPLCGIVVALTGCASAGEFLGRVSVAMPEAMDNVQREQQTGPYQQRPSGNVTLPGVR